MSDDLQTPTEALRRRVADLARALEERGMLRDAAKELAARHAERLFVSANGSIRVAVEDGGFYPPDSVNPLRMLADELYESAPAEEKAAKTEGDLVDRAKERFAQQRASRGVNPLVRPAP